MLLGSTIISPSYTQGNREVVKLVHSLSSSKWGMETQATWYVLFSQKHLSTYLGTKLK